MKLFKKYKTKQQLREEIAELKAMLYLNGVCKRTNCTWNG